MAETQILRKVVNHPVSRGAGADRAPARYRQEAGLQGVGLIYTRRGRAFYETGSGQRCLSQRGDLILLKPPAGQAITYGPAGPDYHWETWWVHFEPRAQWFAWLDWPQIVPGVGRLRLSPSEPRQALVLKQLAAFCRGSHMRALAPLLPRWSYLHFDYLLHDLEAVLLACRMVNPAEHPGPFDPRVQRALQFLDDHLDQPLRLRHVLAAAHLSASQFNLLFKQQVGMTAFAYLESRRMRRAMELLATSEQSIAQIARAVGFEDPHYFSNRFRQFKGTTPTRYQQMERKAPGQSPATRGRDG